MIKTTASARSNAMASNPFASVRYGDLQTYHVTVDDRIQAVRDFNAAQCRAALRLDDLQKTVERAVKARLRHIEREDAKGTS